MAYNPPIRYAYTVKGTNMPNLAAAGASGKKADDWNAAHWVLMRTLESKKDAFQSVDAELGEALERVAALRNRHDSLKKDIEQLDICIVKAGFTPPDGFDIYGQEA